MYGFQTDMKYDCFVIYKNMNASIDRKEVKRQEHISAFCLTLTFVNYIADTSYLRQYFIMYKHLSDFQFT